MVRHRLTLRDVPTTPPPGEQLSGKQAERLARALESNTNVAKLDLSMCDKLGSQGAPRLTAVCGAAPTLSE